MVLDAIVLVGGQGTRLRPLTVTTPKPMLPVAGVPFLTHQLVRLAAAGIDHVVLSTSYRSEVFSAHFGDGSALGLRIDYVTEVEPLGTGGGIRNVADRLTGDRDAPVVVLNGDVLSGHDIASQLATHRDRRADVTLHLTEVEDPRAFGCVPCDPAGRVTAFLEKTPDPVTNRINAGCYVFTRKVIDRIPAGRPVSVERETFPGLLAEGAALVGYVESAYWLDLGTPDAYRRASLDLVTGRASSPALTGPPGPALLLSGAAVAGGADGADGATLGGGSVIGAGARVAPGAVVDESVLLDGVEVGAGARVLRSVLGRDASVGAGCLLDGAVLGDGVRVGAGNELRYGVRLWPGVTLGDVAVRFSTDAAG